MSALDMQQVGIPEGDFLDRCTTAFKQLRIRAKKLTRQHVWRLLDTLRITGVTVEFSGGNDEGATDAITVWYADDVYEYVQEDPNDESPDQRLIHALCQPVYGRWGGFDSGSEVVGQVVWDTKTRQVTADYQETEWVAHTEVLHK